MNCFSSHVPSLRGQNKEKSGSGKCPIRSNPNIYNPSTILIWRKYATYSFVIKYSRAQNKFSIPGFMSKNYSKCARPPKLPGKRAGQCSQSLVFYHFPRKSSILKVEEKKFTYNCLWVKMELKYKLAEYCRLKKTAVLFIMLC